MTTIVSLAIRARRLLVGTQRDEIDFLAAPMLDTDTTLTVELGNTNLTVGSMIEVAFEPMYVKAVAGTTVTVKRAMEGSTAVAHALGDQVRIRPTFTSWDLFRSMQEELSDLSSPQNGLYQVVNLEITPSATPNTYDLVDSLLPGGVASAYGVLAARFQNPSAEWHDLDYLPEILNQWKATDFGSGNALRFRSMEVNMRHRLWIAAPYGLITTTGSSVEADSGIATTATGILPIGAAFRMAIGRELARSMFDRQSDTRRAEEVPPGAQRQGLTPFAALRQEMISTERARLQKLWGV